MRKLKIPAKTVKNGTLFVADKQRVNFVESLDKESLISSFIFRYQVSWKLLDLKDPAR